MIAEPFTSSHNHPNAHVFRQMAVVDSIIKDMAPGALPGLGRTLVAAGKLDQKRAEEIYRKSQTARTSFIAELTGSGTVSARDLAHTMSTAYAAPLLDLDAVDVDRLPKGLLDGKTCLDYRVVVLSKRGNRLIVATADPSDHRAVEKIKFATQLHVDWVIVEFDKLSKLVEVTATTATEDIDNLVGEDFEVDEAPVVKFLHNMLRDAIGMRASDLHFEPYEQYYRMRFRIDGELREIATPPIAIKDKLASRIKVISRLDISEKRVPQEIGRAHV